MKILYMCDICNEFVVDKEIDATIIDSLTALNLDNIIKCANESAKRDLKVPGYIVVATTCESCKDAIYLRLDSKNSTCRFLN